MSGGLRLFSYSFRASHLCNNFLILQKNCSKLFVKEFFYKNRKDYLVITLLTIYPVPRGFFVSLFSQDLLVQVILKRGLQKTSKENKTFNYTTSWFKAFKEHKFRHHSQDMVNPLYSCGNLFESTANFFSPFC